MSSYQAYIVFLLFVLIISFLTNVVLMNLVFFEFSLSSVHALKLSLIDSKVYLMELIGNRGYKSTECIIIMIIIHCNSIGRILIIRLRD